MQTMGSHQHMFTNIEHNLSYLKAFGCDPYVRMPEERRKSKHPPELANVCS